MPFDVDKANPADDSIVSQFPANERESRNQIEQWMDYEHDKTTGRHKIPAGSITARDAQSDYSQGSFWVNTDITPNVLQVQVNPTAPFAWVNVGLQPAGIMAPFAGSSAPSGWLMCYGQEVSRTTYADLFTAIGTAFGSGNGSTTFNLPDARGRVLAGKDDMGGTSAGRLTTGGSGVSGNTLGAAGGNQLMQSHTHNGTTGSENATHTHSYVAFGANGYGINANTGQTSGTLGTTGTQSTNHQHPFTTDSTGSGASQNVQPTIVVNWIIKT